MANTVVKAPQTVTSSITKPKNNNITFITGLGKDKAEIVPGFFIETKKPGLWKRFWLWAFFGIKWN